MIFKPTDMTLAVCFRSWVYATAREDTVLNNSLILSIFGSSTFVSPWRDYFAAHPAPSDSELIRRLIQGASMGVAEHKKLTAPQAARTIVAAFAKHLTLPGLTFSEVLQEVEFLKTFWAVARKEFPAFSPAVCRSEALWAALPRVVRRAVDEPRAEGRGVVSDVLIMYGKMIQTVVNDGPETHADALVHCWVAGGLFDMLEEHLVRIMNLPDGCSTSPSCQFFRTQTTHSRATLSGPNADAEHYRHVHPLPQHQNARRTARTAPAHGDGVEDPEGRHCERGKRGRGAVQTEHRRVLLGQGPARPAEPGVAPGCMGNARGTGAQDALPRGLCASWM